MNDIIDKNFGHLNSKYINTEKIKEDLLHLVDRFVDNENSRLETAREIMTFVMAQGSNVDDEVRFLMEMVPEMESLME